MIKLGIVGTGNMARWHAQSFKGMRGVRLVGACDVVEEKANEFAKTFDIPAAYTDFDRMLAEVEMDAITNVTPDAFHAPVSLKAIRKGLHVLCEKPLAVNYPDARKMATAAKRKGVINMVNLSYRNSSAIHRAHKLVQQGAIGEVKHVEAGYLQGWLGTMDVRQVGKTHPHRLWRLSMGHGSKGVLGDLGVHILDFASYPVGDIKSVNCRLKTFPKVKGDRVGEYVLDANDTAIVTVEFAGGAVGTVHTTRWAVGQGNSIRLRIYGDRGAIVIDLDDSYNELRLCRIKGGKPEWRTVKCAATPSVMHRFVKSIRTGVNDQPDFARGAAVQKALDACFESDSTGRTVKV
jgi:predicted dehydrogenase